MKDSEGRVEINGSKVKALRKEKCFSQQVLVDRCHQIGSYLALSTLKRAESGRKVLYRTAHEIASALEVDLQDILANPTPILPTNKNNPAVQIIGRESQFRQAKHILQSSKELNEGHIFYLRGMAGVGKTHFIKAFEELAKKENFLVFSKSILEDSTTRKDLLKYLVSQAMTQITKREISNIEDFFSVFEQEKFSSEDFSYLCGLLDLHMPPFTTNNSNNYGLRVKKEISIILSLLKKIEQAITIIVEDIHWADEHTLMTLNKLSAELRSLPVVLVLTSRLEDDPINNIWKSAVLNTSFTTQDLPPLTEEESKKFLVDYKAVSEDYKKRCLELAQGYPLFLKQLLENYPNSLENIPQSLSQLVLDKLNKLSENEKLFLQFASAFGNIFSSQTVNELIIGEDINLITLCENFILQPYEDTNYRFSHDLIRQGIYQNINTTERLQIHQKIAEIYKGKDPALYAYHLKRARNTKAKKALQNAAEENFHKQNYSEALAQVDMALMINPEQTNLSLLFLKGILLKLLDLPSKSTQYFQHALTLSSNAETQLKICLELTDIYLVNQRFDRAQTYLERAEALELDNINDDLKRRIANYRCNLDRMQDSLNTISRIAKYSQPEDLDQLISELKKENTQNLNRNDFKGEVEVAVLHSLTGSLKELEDGVIKTTLMALDEINENGGLLGQKIRYEIYNGNSDELEFRRQAQEIFNSKQAQVIFGTSTSSSRKQVKEHIENNDSLLIYPFQYEGLEQSTNIAYVGPPPNLQGLPAMDWLINQGIKSFYLVGSDYIYPLVTNEILKDSIKNSGTKLTGDGYVPLGGTDFSDIIKDIKEKKPESIILTLVGLESNKEFLKQFNDAGLSNLNITILSLVLSENDLCEIPPDHCQDIYSIFSYFQNHNDAVNDDFVRKFQIKYGKDQRIGGYMESAYVGVYLWAKAVQKCQSFEPQKVNQAMKGGSYYGPGGIAYMDEHNQHVWRNIRIAQVGSDGEFHVVWSSDKPIAPEPFPISRSPEEWTSFLANLQQRWHGQWELQEEH